MDLFAATFATVAIAIPTLLIAAWIELTLWPDLHRVVSPAV